ncbi:MAG: hypothetical protein IPI55_19845 [Flavobacteriales bacterium]|nr:hypothetical protein [Flavobacteriales bacterium]
MVALKAAGCGYRVPYLAANGTHHAHRAAEIARNRPGLLAAPAGGGPRSSSWVLHMLTKDFKEFVALLALVICDELSATMIW